ncbi:DegT/DnrJ/EryC1/StrS family aminotransferase [uncultured Gilvimarinus sp.]|uniref:DegT/DnrJ/EryC1/StrS family aminotransferase n=1 Tax=uncultured Gilvimarinus sp. TaxID=1689143 RepID=UPI0030DDA3EF
MSKKPIYVTEPDLPPLDELIPLLERIWESKRLTNGGPLHQELEDKLCSMLGVKYISLFNNGTIALLTAFKALKVQGEVITTPYSFVATSHALLWNGIKPVFVDIKKDTFNMDPNRIEEAITSNTSAILPVHCYGTPCNTEKIQKIADDYNLKVIYDAAHAFGVKKDGVSILNHGDLSILSFHATKVFNTFEGGAIVCHDMKTKKYIDNLKNFGFINETTISTCGINGKMSEINSAIGILQIKTHKENIQKRKKTHNEYTQQLKGIKGLEIPELEKEETTHNYCYFPILIKNDFHITRDQLYNNLIEHNIFPRRYFYPLISQLQMYKELPSSHLKNLPIANKTANSILCLPISSNTSSEDVELITDIIKESAGL